MTLIPAPVNLTLAAIYRGYEREFGAELPRAHLGASLIGRECGRELWYGFRWVDRSIHDGRMLRLFQSGHLEEPRMIADLQRIGVEVHERDPSGAQWRVSAIGGHFGGSLDAAAVGIPEAPKTWHVCEFKTSAEKKWTELAGKLEIDADGNRTFVGGKGVKAAKPEHYAQMQVYMGLTGMSRALYVMKNKNTDDLHVERVREDGAVFKALIDKAHYIITAESPPQRISDDPSWYKCKFCDFKKSCHGDIAPIPTCRSCIHATPELDGNARWSCRELRKDLTFDEQLAGCPRHRFIPALLSKFADAIDAVGNEISYQHHNGNTFVNGESPGAYSSQEIRDMADKSLLGSPEIGELKSVFGARVIG